MLPYAWLRPALFRLDAERAHDLTISGLSHLSAAQARWLAGSRRAGNTSPKEFFGLNFPNPVGLAAGFDKNGDCIDALGGLGFGFIEIGTVTPRPQSGNPRPRMFRLPEHRALINRLGFNNRGVDYLVERLRRRRFDGVVGVNIGKNFDTPLQNAADDYRFCLERVYQYADYVTINISSPNTQGLRDLQGSGYLTQLLESLARLRARLARHYARQVPLLIKIAPDLAAEQIAVLVDALVDFEMDGIVATNTTLSRDAVTGHPLAGEAGGLSGAPLGAPALEILRQVSARAAGQLTAIGVGGILSGADASAKVAAGADLIQLYTGLIYRGPCLIGECVTALNQ